MNPPADKNALLARIASTRTTLGEDFEGIAHALDVPSRLRSSFRLHPVAWVAGAVGVGVLVATLFRRGGNGSGRSQWRPLLLGTLGFLGNRALTLSLPALGGLLEAELNRWLVRRRPAADETPHEARVSL